MSQKLRNAEYHINFMQIYICFGQINSLLQTLKKIPISPGGILYSYCTGLLSCKLPQYNFFLIPSIIYCSIKTPISVCICVCIGLVCVIELHTVVYGQAVLPPYSELLDTFSIFSIWSGHLLMCHLALSAVMSHHLSQCKTSNSAPLTRLCPGLTIPWIKVIDIVDYYSSAFCSHFFLCVLCYLSSRPMPSLSICFFCFIFRPFSVYL